MKTIAEVVSLVKIAEHLLSVSIPLNCGEFQLADNVAHYENIPIQMYCKFYHQKRKIFR